MSQETRAARLIAFYLPQFHPIPENDEWWGPGFTEWTNVAKAKPLYRGHYQPHLPAELGFYDLRVPETRQAQADLAREHGIEAFCYWHYWFAGRRILERPFSEVLTSGEPDFPFCLGWANQTWTGIWHGNPDRILIEQTYPGVDDHVAHFDAMLPAFEDPRYFRVDGKPLFYVFKPRFIPELRKFADLWRQLARRAGLPGLYLVGEEFRPWDPIEWGFDAACDSGLPTLRGWEPWSRPIARLKWEWWKCEGAPLDLRLRRLVRGADPRAARQPSRPASPSLPDPQLGQHASKRAKRPCAARIDPRALSAAAAFCLEPGR